MGRDEQLSLFGEPEPPSNSRTVGAAAVPEDVQAVAGALPGNIRLGTSSWSFPGWEGLVYDREASKAHLARRGLGAYAKHPLLRTVGIDRTFYAPIPASEFAAYAEAVPEDFRFLVKASSECTMPLLRDSSGRLAEPNPRYLDPKAYWQDIRVDDWGFIWLHARYPDDLPDGVSRWFVLSPEGEYLGQTISPGWADVQRGHSLAVEDDPETAERMPVVYRIRPAVEGLQYSQ